VLLLLCLVFGGAGACGRVGRDQMEISDRIFFRFVGFVEVVGTGKFPAANRRFWSPS
jgi:hypothetical protein